MFNKPEFDPKFDPTDKFGPKVVNLTEPKVDVKPEPKPKPEPVKVDPHTAAATDAKKKSDALRAQAADLIVKAAKLEADATEIDVTFAEVKPGPNWVRAEGGGWFEVKPGFGPRDTSVVTPDGKVYFDHASDHASGDWVYRLRTK